MAEKVMTTPTAVDETDAPMTYLTIDPQKIRLLELNAHYMPHDKFQQLVENMKQDGCLMHAPFGAYWRYYSEEDEVQYDKDGDPILEVLSGNHRVLAARAAGLREIEIKCWTRPMSHEERIARQLAGNAINGDDDEAILRQLYDQIEDVGWKQYSGLDDKVLGLLEDVSLPSIGEAGLDFQTITFTFLPHEVERVTAVWEQAMALVNSDEVFLARWGEYDRLLDALAKSGAAYGIKNTATSLLAILAVFDRHRLELATGWYDPEQDETRHNGWVSIDSILGRDDMPADELQKVRQAVEKMVSTGEVESKERWRALVLLADRYLQDS